MLDLMARRRDARRRAIVAAARVCFLRHGYDKTSLLDIARETRLSRPLLYLVFESKEEILRAVFEIAYAEAYAAVAALLRGEAPPSEKLAGIYERLVLDPWGAGGAFEASRELARAFARVAPALAAGHERRRLRYTQALLRSKEAAEVFALAVDGLRTDSPPPATFRKRLHLLAARFAAPALPRERTR